MNAGNFEVFYSTLNENAKRDFKTQVGNIWIVRDADNKDMILIRHQVTREPMTLLIGNSSTIKSNDNLT